MKTEINFQIINEDIFFSEKFWIKFRKDFEQWLLNFSSELKKIYLKELKNLSNEDLATYLYVPACRDFLNKYQSINSSKSFKKKINKFKSSLIKSTFISIDKYTDEIVFNNTEFFRFFFRHENLFPSYSKYDKGALRRQSAQYFVGNLKLQRLLNNYSFKTIKLVKHIATLLVNINMFTKIKKLPKNILTSNHWAQNDSLHQAFLSYAKSNGSSIYVLQGSFAHPFFAFDDQFEYEKRIATHFITWQKNSLEKELKKIELPFGSFYCKRKSTIKEGTCVTLPQIPINNILKGRSISFGLGKSLFFKSESLSYIKEYIFNLVESSQKTIYLRTKSISFSEYENEFKILKDKIKFDHSDINNGGHLPVFEDMRICYFGTAIPEAFFNGSSVSLAYHPSNEIVLKNKYRDFNKKPLNETIHNLCKPSEIEAYENLFSKLGA